MTPLMLTAMRYLGVRTPDAQSIALVSRAAALLGEVAPRHVLIELPIRAILDAFPGKSLARHLAGCDRAGLLAATLGAEADQRIRRAESTDVAMAAALHAYSAARIELYCDSVQEGLPEARRPRFSPGYGDLPLSAQRTLLALTDAGRRIGLYLTDACMLAPVKSVTAILGYGPPLDGCPTEKCARCERADCPFREEETPCR